MFAKSQHFSAKNEEAIGKVLLLVSYSPSHSTSGADGFCFSDHSTVSLDSYSWITLSPIS